MRVLIIEDEAQAAARLQMVVRAVEPGVVVLAVLDTVKAAVAWLREQAAPDLIFMDIQLADGISFMIFDQCQVPAPVIFTTAYDAYALRAFKVNSIDYILKPVDQQELAGALEKFRTLAAPPVDMSRILGNVEEAMQRMTKKYKARFMVKVGEHLRTVEIKDILYFYSHQKTTFCITVANRQVILDYTLEQLEELVDPALFFRVNRQYLVEAQAIQDIIQYTNSRLRLVLQSSGREDIIVARERVAAFKAWLDQ